MAQNNYPGQIAHNNYSTPMTYNNTVLTITDTSTADPYLMHKDGNFYMTWTAGDRIEIWSSASLLDFGTSSTKHTVWRPPPSTAYSADLWAPELHDLHGRWYVYFAAADPRFGNKSHRMYILGGPPSTIPPTSGSWEFLGGIIGMPDQWAIDGTVITLQNSLYFIYSGWPMPNPGNSELTQDLYIVRLASPTEAASPPSRISQPLEPWERSGDHGINEGPQVLASPDGSWLGVAYSCAGSWTKEYKMATLQYLDGDPLNPSSWRKGPRPLLETRGQPPFGPGHGSFLNMGGETLGIFHGTDGPGDGWEGRKARCMRVVWGPQGPMMGDGRCGPLGNVQQFMGQDGFEGGAGRHGGGGAHGLRGFLHKMKEEIKKEL